MLIRKMPKYKSYGLRLTSSQKTFPNLTFFFNTGCAVCYLMITRSFQNLKSSNLPFLVSHFYKGVSQTDVVTPVAAIEPEEPTKPPNHQELEDAKEKIKNLQAACDAYKAEIEKMKHLRHRRTGSGTISAAISAQKQVSEKETPSWVLFIVIIAFLVGAWLF
jgi:hypothetical protein